MMNFSARLARRLAALAFLTTLAGSAAGAPIGYLQVEGAISVQPAQAEAAVRISENNYTVFSGDRLATGQGSAVLVLNGDGVVGLGRSSVARVSRDERSRTLTVHLDQGALLFAIPQSSGMLDIKVSDFVLQTGIDDADRILVEQARDEASGMVERLADGHIRVAMRSGELHARGAGGSRYRVAAGEQVGLLANAAGTIEHVAFSLAGSRLAEIEAPERVSTREDFSVRWHADGADSNSYITIAPQGSGPEEFDSVVSTSLGNTLRFQAPSSAGDYEIRFVNANGQVTDFVYLQVTGDRIAGWWPNREAVIGLSLVAGSIGYWIILDNDDDDDDVPVSP